MADYTEIHISNVPKKLKESITEIAKKKLGTTVADLIKSHMHHIINKDEFDDIPPEKKRFASKFVKSNMSLIIENDRYRSLSQEQKQAVQTYLKMLI